MLQRNKTNVITETMTGIRMKNKSDDLEVRRADKRGVVPSSSMTETSPGNCNLLIQLRDAAMQQLAQHYVNKARQKQLKTAIVLFTCVTLGYAHSV